MGLVPMPSRRYRPLLGCEWDWVGVVRIDHGTGLGTVTLLYRLLRICAGTPPPPPPPKKKKKKKKIRRYSAIWNNTEPVSNGNLKMYVQ